jgi:hypothetical protein
MQCLIRPVSMFSTFICLVATAAPPGTQCPPYTVERAKSFEIGPEDDLREVLATATKNTVIYLKSGIYRVGGILQIITDSITVRSKTGNRDDVILDGNSGGTSPDRSKFTPEIVAISATDVHLVDISICHAHDHAIHVYPPAEKSISGCLMHNLHVYDCGQQLIKVNANGNESNPCWADRGILEGSLVEFIDNSMMQDNGDYFYTGGIDVHAGQDWIVRWNHFRNIQRDGKLMEHAVHFWSKSRGTVVENNRFENVYRAIGFGMKTSDTGPMVRSYPDNAGTAPYFDHVGGIIRNNVVFNRGGIHLESGIELSNVNGTEVYHNTVYSVDPPFSSIEYRFPNTRVAIVNNLVSQRIMLRDGATATVIGNNVSGVGAGAFIDAADGDLHLTAGADAIDRGSALDAGKAGVDIDGEVHGDKPDIGADEFGYAGVVGYRSSGLLPGTPSANRSAWFLINGKRYPGCRAGSGKSRVSGTLAGTVDGRRCVGMRCTLK